VGYLFGLDLSVVSVEKQPQKRKNPSRLHFDPSEEHFQNTLGHNFHHGVVSS
jgi:hypothetical protein